MSCVDVAARGSTGNSKTQYRPAFLDHFEAKEQQSAGGKPTNNNSQSVQQGAPHAQTPPRQDISQIGGGGYLQSFQRSFIEGDFDFVSTKSDIINLFEWLCQFTDIKNVWLCGGLVLDTYCMENIPLVAPPVDWTFMPGAMRTR